MGLEKIIPAIAIILFLASAAFIISQQNMSGLATLSAPKEAFFAGESFKIDPTAQTVALNSTVYAKVKAENIANFGGFQFSFTYDSSKLQFNLANTEINFYDASNPLGTSTQIYCVDASKWNSTIVSGSIKKVSNISCARLAAGAGGTVGIVATIKFTAIAVGTNSPVSITDLIVSDIESNSIATSVTGGTITIQSAPPANNAQCTSYNFGNGTNIDNITMATGETRTVTVTVKNTGTAAWTSALAYKLGSQDPADNTRWNLSRVLLGSSDSIATNASKTFSFSIKAPTTAGTYTSKWKMLKESVEWFGEICGPSTITTTATPLVENCSTSADDDGDGLINCTDFTDCPGGSTCDTGKKCNAQKNCIAPTAENCTNSIDDDADGLTDCADPDCAYNSTPATNGTCCFNGVKLLSNTIPTGTVADDYNRFICYNGQIYDHVHGPNDPWTIHKLKCNVIGGYFAFPNFPNAEWQGGWKTGNGAGVQCGIQDCGEGYCTGNSKVTYPPTCSFTCNAGNCQTVCTCSGTTVDCTTAKYCAGAGVCNTCPVGQANCDEIVFGTNQCEISINTDVNNCGSCGTRCTASQFCNNGACAQNPTCTTVTQAADCDDHNPCTNDTCTNGTCTNPHTFIAAGTVCAEQPNCDVNSLCTGKTCNATGQCNVLANCTICPNSLGVCGQSACTNGTCTNPILSGRLCTDNNSLTLNDSCNLLGRCIGIPITGCVSNWSCTSWSASCIDNYRTRTCTDSSHCGSESGPDEAQSCGTQQGDCTSSTNCDSNSYCSSGKCNRLNCSIAQRIESHQCVDIAHPECDRNEDCLEGFKCESQKCARIQCPAGQVLSGRTCIPETPNNPPPACTGITCNNECHTEAGVCCNNNWNLGFTSCSLAEVSTAVTAGNKSQDQSVKNLAVQAQSAMDSGKLQKAKAYALATIAFAAAVEKNAFKQEQNEIIGLLEKQDFVGSSKKSIELTKKAQALTLQDNGLKIPAEIIFLVILGIALLGFAIFFITRKSQPQEPDNDLEEPEKKTEKDVEKIMKELKKKLKD